MNLSKSILRRLLSCLFALALLVVSFPASAFALETGVQLSRKNFAFDGENFSIDGPDAVATAKLGGTYIGNNWRVSEDNTADLWIYSTDMTAAGEADGSTVPYVIDGAGQKWVLKEIAIANYKTIGGDGEYNGFQVVMTSDQIEAASTTADYIIDTTNLNITPYPLRPTIPYYYVWYGWKLADAVEGLTTYNVSYDLNFPTGATTLYPVWNEGGIDVAESNGSKGDVEGALEDMSKTVYSNQDYTVSDFPDTKPYGDFIAFTHDTDYGHDYYDFGGWTVKDKDESTVYQIGQSIPGDQLASLADADGNITFVAKWTPIEPWDDDDLKAASEALTVNAVTKIDNETPLITQSVNGADATGNTVTLKADDTISYTVQTRLGGNLGANTNPNGITPSGDFATFTYQVKVDKNLEFVDTDQDGQVTLTLDSDNFVPTGSNIPAALINADQKTITFDPNDVPKAEDGRMNISVTMQYLNGQKLESTDPIILSGLVFKVKDSAIDSYGVVPEIKTYANVTGSINLYEKSPISWRFFYQSVSSFLSQADWHKYFGLDDDWHNYPAAVAHASQFIDYKLKNFDLSTDPTATLEDNTVVANSEDEKTSYPALDKKVQTGTSNDQPVWGEATTAAANDTVSFQLNSNVPQDLLNYITYDDAKDPSVVTPQIATLSEENRGSYELVFHDQMDEAFTNLDGLQVVLDRQGSENDVTLVSGQYTYTTDTGDDCSFHIVIDLAKLYASDVINNDDIQNVTPITVTYTATLASDVAAGKYLNTAWVTYPGEGESEHSTVSVTTYGINIFKYDQAKGVDDADAGLAGAEFKIYGSDAVDEDGNLKADATLIRENAVVSGDDGHVIIDGLNVGTYYLVETKAPTGYVKSDKPLEVIIPDKVDETTYRAAVNFANSLVPHTGGTGTVMYTVGGLAIIVLAGILLVVYRKSRKKQDR